MSELLIVVDMQNDFVSGTLSTPEAYAIVDKVRNKVENARKNGIDVVFTRDTHSSVYLNTQEGKRLPVPHCIKGSDGWKIIDELDVKDAQIFDKPTFASIELANYVAESMYTRVELVGLCTDICVISNAMLLKAFLPEMQISVDAECCAGVTPESHKNALSAMKMCQIDIINE